jgi:hypothetical protein
MGKVIPFPAKEQEDEEIMKMLRISDEIDDVILKHLNGGAIDPKDLAGLLAHRLGTLMRSIDEKSKLWDVCQRVLKKQAKID